MRVTLQNQTGYTDDSLRAVCTAVFHTHSPYRKVTKGVRLRVRAHSAKDGKVWCMLHTDAKGDELVLRVPPPDEVTDTAWLIKEVVNAMRWACMSLAGIGWADMPSDIVADWPGPQWLSAVPSLVAAPPPEPVVFDPKAAQRELEEKKAWATQQLIKKARQELTAAQRKLKRTQTSIKFWEKKIRSLQRQAERADRRFLKGDHGMSSSVIAEAERNIAQAMKDLE
jgi:hypothetical protein